LMPHIQADSSALDLLSCPRNFSLPNIVPSKPFHRF